MNPRTTTTSNGKITLPPYRYALAETLASTILFPPGFTTATSTATTVGNTGKHYSLDTSAILLSVYAQETYLCAGFGRHVILPKPMLKLLPQAFFDPAEPGVLRILNEEEWRGLGITQSMGWEHYEVHAPEPHILLFRREKDFLQKVSACFPCRRGS